MTAATIAIEDPDQPALRVMMAAADAHYFSLYPAERNYLLDVAALQRPGIAFYVARVAGEARGFGALVPQAGDWAEIKRMYVDPAARGRGLGTLILGALEAHARRIGVRTLRLETGIKQPAAIALYRAAGFRNRDAFGDYAADPISVFLEKTL